MNNTPTVEQTKAAHAPGPWYFAPGAHQHLIASESDPTGRTLAVVNDEANARLIAAAPELLEALREIRSICREDEPSIKNIINICENVARAALAKAGIQ